MPAEKTDRYLLTAEAAKALGITPRALRLYERKGLVRPTRSAAGWRAYGSEALTRLHQILALKQLGLTLQAVGELLAGKRVDLDDVLALQERALTERQADLARGLELIRKARERLAAGASLSLDELTTLTKETIMSDEMPEWAKKVQSITTRNFTDEDRAKLAARPAFDQDEVTAQWNALRAEALSLLGTDPAAPQAVDLARRWKAMVARFTGGDPSIHNKLSAAWKETLADKNIAPSMPRAQEVIQFVEAASKHLKPGP